MNSRGSAQKKRSQPQPRDRRGFTVSIAVVDHQASPAQLELILINVHRCYEANIPFC